MTELLLFAAIGYACGSIPFGLILTRLAGFGDVRTIGSGNIGATNVLRTGNKKIAALTLLCDGLKGFFPVLAAVFWGSGYAPLAAAGGAMAGHIFPVWLGFKGGKGVATFIGALFGLNWMLGLAFVGVWIVCAYLFRISSLSALVSAAAVPVAALVTGQANLFPALVALSAIVWIKHWANIKRLLDGTEPKISLGS